MKRQMLTLGCVLLLGACGGQDTRTPVALDNLVVPASAPWLQVEQKPLDVVVRGLDTPLVLAPTPSLAAVLQAQLRQALQASYITNLVVACAGVEAQMRVDSDATPASVALELGLRCTVNAQGFVSVHDYRVQPSLPVPADADYRKALTALLDTASKDVGARLKADVLASKGNLQRTPH